MIALNVLLWYGGLFLLTCGLGVPMKTRKTRLVVLACFVPIFFFEPMLAQTFNLSWLPPTFFMSFFVNGVEISGYCSGWLIGNKIRMWQK